MAPFRAGVWEPFLGEEGNSHPLRFHSNHVLGVEPIPEEAASLCV
jgi:hypothetical protein